MKYDNAGDILPEELLKEVQKYAAGKLLYVPSGEDRRAWGETSGYREQLQRRNRMIRNKYAHGLTVSELADEYFLSLDSIKKIIYSKKSDGQFTYSPTLESAIQYADAGMMEEWVQCYLLLTRNASSVLQDFMKEPPLYFGVVKVPLRLIQRVGSDSGDPVTSEPIGLVSDFPPLLIQYESGMFYCPVQQQLLASLRERRVNAYPAIIVLSGSEDYKRFMKYYGNIFFYVDKA